MSPVEIATAMPVYVIAVGAQTSVGLSALTSAAAVRAGLANFTEHPWIIDRHGESVIAARATWLPPELPTTERMLAMATAAATEAVRPVVECLQRLGASCSLSLGLPAERPGFSRQSAQQLFDELGKQELLQGFFGKNQAILAGHAAGLVAIELGCHLITDGTADVCLAGGADSYIDAETLDWLDGCHQLHSPNNNWGFVPGEGAAFCLLASESMAKRIGAAAPARVITAVTARENNRIKTKTVCTGEGLSAAYRQALAVLPSESLVDDLICDLNGEPYRADEFGFALIRTSARFRTPGMFRAPADCWGDVGAASGPLFMTLPFVAVQRNYAKSIYTMFSTSSETGERSTCLLATDLARMTLPR